MLLGTLLACWLVGGSQAQLLLTPAYFNIAENRPIKANATCGDTGLEKEPYCKLVGGGFSSNLQTGQSSNFKDGQVCDFCLPMSDAAGLDRTKMHGPENANDGDISTWWQSPPISRGRKYNRVDLEIDLLQSFQVAYVVVTMADSPRPGVWALEKSLDNGSTWTPWQYFASNDAECQRYFNMHADERIIADDTVTCSTEFSKVLPLEGGEIFVALTTGRPSQNNIQESQVMLNWLTATNIRIRLMQTKTMLGHLMSVAQGDNTVTRRYYYAIKEISIGGRCVCNGHAYICPASPLDPNILQCDCQHGTTGLNCDECMDGYRQKNWRRHTRSDPFECEPCNCNKHSDKCHYNATLDAEGLSLDIHGHYEGGGQCDDCQHFTTGINCDTCVDGYFRPPDRAANDTTPCILCDCPDPRHTGNCEAGGGRCECKEAWRGADDCTVCAQGFYGYPDCEPCPCSIEGTMLDAGGIPVCVTEGEEGTADLQCPCKGNFGGEFCDRCADGFYNYPECTPCGCNDQHSTTDVCNLDDGQCSCEVQYGGRSCEECSDGHFDYPNCATCSCDPQGSEPEICSKEEGDCLCREGYGGDRCDQCAVGWWGYPRCEKCECSEEGAAATDRVCDPVDGQCPCHHNFGGRQCIDCTPGYYQYPKCYDCGCDSAGSVGQSCDASGVCSCKEGYVGEKCDQCAPDTYNYPLCELCTCNPAGVSDNFWTLGGCDSVPEGELCDCKSRVTGRTCDSCKPLFWKLQQHNPDGCEDCDCFRDGTIGRMGVCDQLDGQCACKPAVGGDPDAETARRCQECLAGYFELTANSLLGCTDCDCDLGGSEYRPGQSPQCDVASGQCECKNGMRGRRCSEVMAMHYTPLLYQFKYEIEDGYRADASKVVYDYKQAEFPNFSWKGYASFSQLQDEVLQDISLTKASSYNTVLRYVNPNLFPLVGTVSIYPVGQPDSPEAIVHKVALEPSLGGDPAFVTVSGEQGVYPSPFELQPGQYTVSLNIDNNDVISQPVLVDYLVLLPTDYVKPSVLRQEVTVPCRRGPGQEYCRRYSYPPMDRFPSGMGREALRPNSVTPGQFYDFKGDESAFPELGVDKEDVVQLASWQPEIHWNVQTSPGKHVAALTYFTEGDNPTEGRTLQVTIKDQDNNVVGEGEAFILDCPYDRLCRQVVTDSDGRVVEFYLPGVESRVVVQDPEQGAGGTITLERVVLVPTDNWSEDFIRPTPQCVVGKMRECIELPNSRFTTPQGSVTATPSLILQQRPARQKPKVLHDPDTPLVYIQRFGPDHAEGKVDNPDNYAFMVHYYQPDHPKLYLNVTITDGIADDPERGDQGAGAVIVPDFPVYQAVLPLPTCTDHQGCRSGVLRNPDDKELGVFPINQEFDIHFKNEGPDGAWIEYVMAVPAGELQPALLTPDDSVDRAEEFQQQCGQEHFFMSDRMDEGFCRASVTSISAGFNDRALECECDAEGSVDEYNCNSFGGQCQCKPHVIGQSCTRCEPEYFGFPSCQPCSCPSTATCNEDSGECICAPFVTGTQDAPCTTCEVNTYGYNAVTGCQECNCWQQGTEGGDISCSLESGQCSCAPRVEGRQCDHCTWGAWDYPACEACDCHTNGTVTQICDQETSECLCKDNVEDGRCDTCKEGFFNLQASDPLGCMECFCSERSSTCSSHPGLVASTILSMDDWSHATFTFASRAAQRSSLDVGLVPAYMGEIRTDFQDLIDLDTDFAEQTYYFQSSPAYAGSQIKSFGSDLTWNITYWGRVAADSKKTPDVILQSGQTSLLFFSGKLALEGSSWSMRVPLLPVAGQWLTPVGNTVDRRAMMAVLNRLDAVYIKGSFGAGPQTVQLTGVSLGSGRPVQGAVAEEQRPGGVELCQCPAGYTGFSCQLCSPGYFSLQSDAMGPICQPCQCHGHARSCHPNTGVCESPTVRMEILDQIMCEEGTDGCEKRVVPGEPTSHDDGVYSSPDDFCHFNPRLCEIILVDGEVAGNCGDNTMGDNCELCAKGYFGDATRGESEDCQACPCPLAENNFAESCDNVGWSGDRECVCKPNYMGPTCGECGSGYFGNPNIPGGDCQPCECNGNIDTSDPSACNSISGLCQLCEDNTTGDHCERCQNWFYGDAVSAKNCVDCQCDPIGTKECDHYTGQCVCKPGVEGELCDRCAADHWNFESGEGCRPCECTDASVESQCNQKTGQCDCKDGVRGQTCSICMNGFWNLGQNGCEKCTCNIDYAKGGSCDQETGQCQCLPYVDGINCDGCPKNHILIQNEWRSGPELPAWKEPFDHENGCFPCESCIADLMLRMDKITDELEPIMEDFQSKKASFYAQTRLNYIASQIDQLKPEISLLDPAVGNSKIRPLEEATARLTGLSKSLNLEYKLERLNEWAEKAEVLAADGNNAVESMGLVGVQVGRVINDVKDIVMVLAQGMNEQLQATSLKTAEDYLARMQQKDFTETRLLAEAEQNAARALMEEVKVWSLPVEEFKQNLEAKEERLDRLKGMIEDISNRTQTAQSQYQLANKINWPATDPQASRKIEKIKNIMEATEVQQTLSIDQVDKAEEFVDQARGSYSGLDYKKQKIEDDTATFKDRVETYDEELRSGIPPLESEAAYKARELTDQANNIQQISMQAQQPAQDAIQAATAFKSIIEHVTEAKAAADTASSDSDKAARMSEGLADKASKELARINEMYTGSDGHSSTEVLDVVRREDGLASRLNKTQSDVSGLKQQTTDIKQDLESITDNLEKIIDLSEDITETKKLAGESLKDGDDALASINARANEISSKKSVAYEVRNNHTAFDVAKTNIKKALNEYESKPNRDKREDGRIKRDAGNNDITDRLNRLSSQKDIIAGLAVSNSDLVVSIQDHLATARRLLDRMNKPAVSFSPGSTLELKNPENLEDLATKTDISFYVKGVGATNDTAEASDRAFMFYLGNLEGTSKKLPKVLSDDFMAIEVMKSAFVQLTMDLGSGPVTLTSTKPLKANDWSQVVVRREGRNVELLVRTEKGPGEQEEDSVVTTFPLLDAEGQPHLSGSVFNLHQEYSKIYVGGFPTGSGVQQEVRAPDMTGQIEGLMIGGKEVGLWNYKAATLIQHSDETRNKFIPQKLSELRFEGDGYMSLKPEEYYMDSPENFVEFEFRAMEGDGLMFLAGNAEWGFLAVTLRDSMIVFSYKLGTNGNVVEIKSEPVELETWVRVRVERIRHEGTLLVDGVTVGNGQADTSSDVRLSSVSDLYIGGYPHTDYVDLQQDNFYGCIKNAKIDPHRIDNTVITSDQVKLVNVELECEPPRPPMQSTVSFMEATPGYVKLPERETNGSLTISFMFRTSATEGVMAYLIDSTGFYYISLTMKGGALHLYAHPTIQMVTQHPQTQEVLLFNDNQWHVVSVTVLEEPRKMIFLQVDDIYEAKDTSLPNVPLVTGTSYAGYFGGLPEDLDIQTGVMAHRGPFVGCIRDLVMQEEYVDWEVETSLTGATLGTCSVVGDVAEPESPSATLAPVTEAPQAFDIQQIFPDIDWATGSDIQGNCGLPVSPALDPELNIDSGLRFGVKTGSYIEYIKKNLPEMITDQNRFQIEFKTSKPEGMIFFMGHDAGKTDFIALFLKGGKLVYSFNCGSGPSHLATENRVNDGKWHSVEFSRVAKHGKLVLDSIEVKVEPHNKESAGSTTNLEVKPNIYMGGVSRDIATNDDIKRDLQFRGNGNIPGFIGCLRNLKYEMSKNGKTRMKSLGTKWANNNMVIPCSEKVEPGYFFGPKGGRIRAETRFRVGLDFDITMMIKPRNLTGILAAVRGRRDYLVLYMDNGAIQFTVDNGRGPITAVFKPSDKHEFCNGQWHEIHAVKAKNVVTLSVNKIFAQPGIGVPGVSSTDTNNPLFLGGHPRPGKFGISGDAVNYSGCMKDVVIEGKPVQMTDDRIIGDIGSHVCPTI